MLPIVALRPLAGLHEYEVAPEAVNVVVLPLHMLVLDSAVTVGVRVTLTVTAAELVQVPTPPVTVYVVVPEGEAITWLPDVVLSPVAGLQV